MVFMKRTTNFEVKKQMMHEVNNCSKTPPSDWCLHNSTNAIALLKYNNNINLYENSFLLAANAFKFRMSTAVLSC